MGKRGPKPKGNVKIRWSPNFAYAIGLLASDGCLSSDGRHIDLTSNDIDQLKNFNKALNINMRITPKSSGRGYTSYHIQFSDVLFYRFLYKIGMTTVKSKTLGRLEVPDKYFFDFLRGCYDGDGCFYGYWDPRWKSSYMFYLTFVSASEEYLLWLSYKIYKLTGLEKKPVISKNNRVHDLRFAKSASLELLRKMYYTHDVVCLGRKKDKIIKLLNLVGESI